MNLQITASEVKEEKIYTLTPTLKFTEDQKNNDAKLYSLKDIFDSCAKVSTVEVKQPTAPTAAPTQPLARG